ncbi:TPA: DUF5448 family protein [Enterobacter hormaechei]|uniref:DUF5448 family protein n=1 Tax=Enterobacter hormaechei TaxID=158836 RepID=UPI00079A425E|nr:DUF5448 family protein [Enterobacter hormaechei]SAB23790.1 Uncharacterised protein [Enterobacter hormaechei]SAI43628.1 Uncharacterised protein [Enterobacter hormaechei]HCT9390143.1 DUF5448 family protein [Enterobacter hormaechei]
MTDINVKKLTNYDLEELQRDIAREIKRRASGPTRVVYVVTEWGEHRAFADFRCAAICFSDIAETIMEDAGTEEGKEKYDLNKGTLLYGIRPVEMALHDFEAKVAQKYFDDVCFEKRLEEVDLKPLPVEPAGWQLVPKEITLEMESALSAADSYSLAWKRALAVASKYRGSKS